MNFTETMNDSFGFAFGAAASYGCGFIYGSLWRLDRTMTARAFAISIAADCIFEALVKNMTGGKDEDAKRYYTYKIIGGTALAVLQIAAFRRLNLIGSLGTAFLTFNAIMLALKYNHGYYYEV